MYFADICKDSSDLSCKAFNQTLLQSYADHLQQNSSNYIEYYDPRKSFIGIIICPYLLTAVISSLYCHMVVYNGSASSHICILWLGILVYCYSNIYSQHIK